jgi:tight adherence protein B
MNPRLIVASVLGALAIPAAAHASVGVRGVDFSAYPTVRLTVVTGSDSAAPTIRENGAPVAGLRVANLGRNKSVALLLDRSESMAGKPFADAVRAATTFSAATPASDRVAVFAFGSHAAQLTGFSSLRDDADGALGSLTVDEQAGTALYDAIAMAATALSHERNRGHVILVVTDGKDVSSRADAARAIAAAEAARVPVYAIGIEGPQFTAGALREIADRTGGLYRGASSSGALAEIFTAIARELRRTWLVDYATPGRPGDHLRLQVAARGDGADMQEVVVPGHDAPGGGSALPEIFYRPGGAALFSAGIGLIVLLAFAVVRSGARSGRLRRQLAPHVGDRRGVRKQRRTRQRLQALARLFHATERTFAHTRLWSVAGQRLDRADIPLRTVEFVYLDLAVSLGLGLVTGVAGAGIPFVLLAFALGGVLPVAYVWFKARRRQGAFETQLPDLLMSLAASLKAGHSFRQGLQAIVDEGLEPTGKELKRVLNESRLGRPIEESLAEMAERIGSKNFAFIVTAVNIQSQVGGSLAGLFDMVADTVRQRQQFQRKIRSLTAMGRMSAYVLIGLPFFMAAALTAMNPGYMSPLYHSSTGHKLVVAALVMMGIGSLLLKRIVAIKG